MEGHGQIDDLFRKTLEGQRVEPGKSLWRGINRKLLFREMIRFNFSNLPGTFWITGIAGIVVISIILYLTLSPGTKIPSKPNQEPQTIHTVPLTRDIKSSGPNMNSSIEKPSIVSSDEMTPVTKAGSNQPLNEKTSKEINQSASASINKDKKPHKGKQETISTQLTEKKKTIKTKSIQKSESTVLIAANIPAVSPSRSNIKSKPGLPKQVNENVRDEMPPEETKISNEVAKQPQPAVSNPSIPHMLSLTSFDSLEKVKIKYPTLNLVNLGIFPTSKEEHAVIPQYLSLGLGFMPEITFYKTNSSYSKVNYWLGVDLAYHLWKFYIRPGISIGYMYDNGAYRVNYKRKDSIGFYYEVVSYSIDPHNPGVIIYNTVNHTVYDSLIHNGTDQTRNRYQYIQIPLIFGFDVIELKNFGFSVQTGPVVSFFMAEKETSSQYTDLTSARLLTRIKSTPPGKNPNWQIWGGIHMEYRIDENFDFYLEPTYKYYFNPVVGNEVVSVKAPWTVGLGLGFKYNFGFNTLKP